MNEITLDKNKSNLVGKRMLVIKHNAIELELPLSVSKICATCPYWENGTLIFSGSTLRPKCNRNRCTGYLEEKDVDPLSCESLFDGFSNLFDSLRK